MNGMNRLSLRINRLKFETFPIILEEFRACHVVNCLLCFDIGMSAFCLKIIIIYYFV